MNTTSKFGNGNPNLYFRSLRYNSWTRSHYPDIYEFSSCPPCRFSDTTLQQATTGSIKCH